VDGLISGNTIIQPTSAGIYMPGDGNAAHTTAVYNSSNTIISNNLIDGQTSQDDATLKRGGIVIGNLTDILVTGNKIFRSFGGIFAGGQNTGTVTIEGNTCASGVTVPCTALLFHQATTARAIHPDTSSKTTLSN
jgi:hypothetical protein